jgi:tRNA threonylcarbamoyladenosine biosynthesis protein TsaB
MEAKYLLIETSVAQGKVGLAEGQRVLAQTPLNTQHRHNRDLAPAIASLLQSAGCRPGNVTGVIVSSGPGSYTGLRVGVMSAKTFAYAIGCPLIPVQTFWCVARQAPPEVDLVDVIADAQQGQVYVQRFVKDQPGDNWRSTTDLAIEPMKGWIARRESTAWASGPALVTHAKLLSGQNRLVSAEHCFPGLESLLLEALDKGCPLTGNEMLALEPLYLRSSSAEEKWAELGK